MVPYYIKMAKKFAAVNVIDEPENKSTMERTQLSQNNEFPAGEQNESQDAAPSVYRNRVTTAGKPTEKQKCKYCDKDATASLIWVDGRAYVPSCDEHKDKTEDDIAENGEWAEEIGWREIHASIESDIYEAIGEASMCWLPIPDGVFDSTKASEIAKRLMDKIGSESGQNLGDLTTEPPAQGDDKFTSIHMDQSLTMKDQDTSEGGDFIHMGAIDEEADVEAPHSVSDGPLGTRFDDDYEFDIVMHAKLGKGKDPYIVGKLYSYNELIPQHQHEIDINWPRKKYAKSFMWLRTSMPVKTILAESEQWYTKNRNKKWALTDRNRVIDLAEVFMKGATVTPLMVSPVGEHNGGLWEGYHRLNALDMLNIEVAPVLMKVDLRNDNWKSKVADQDRQPWVAIDLDGTILAEDESFDGDGRPPLGEPFQGAKEALQAFMDAGCRVSIWTARQYFEDDDSEDAEWQTEIDEHLKYHMIPYSDIYVGKKPPADVFIDNKAVNFDGNWSEAAGRATQMLKISRIASNFVDGKFKPLMPKIASGHTGTFIGLVVPEEVANDIAIEGGEPPEELHITMFYQKGMSKEDAEQVRLIWDSIWSEYGGQVSISIGKCDTFEATEHSDNKTPLICPVDSKELQKMHSKLLANIEAHDIELNQTFPDYKPHITLKYLDNPDDAIDSIEKRNFIIRQYVFDPGSGETKEATHHDGPLSGSDDAEDSYTDIDESRGDLSINPEHHVTA